MDNIFCSRADITNEATVELLFINRLLVNLGYKDKQIVPKASLEQLVTNRGSAKGKHRPDYALKLGTQIRWIIEAKAPKESLDDHVGQAASYCHVLNRSHPHDNPVRYFMLSNGMQTRVYHWDSDYPVLTLDFMDFVDDSDLMRQLRDLLSASSFTNAKHDFLGPTHVLEKKPIEAINADFAFCHQYIHRKDDFSQSRAFMEFVKVVFLKLLSDKEIHKKYPGSARTRRITVPAADVRFSVRWIEDRESDHPNPLDALQFQNLLRLLEAQIQEGNKKRIFDPDEHINLAPETVKGVVQRLEHTDLYGIDADLNGRLFETFLNATMRGKDLGQYFTPRSVVKLAVQMADIQVSRKKSEIVVDACCGSGGFLIDVLANMWGKVDADASLSSAEKDALKQEIACERIFGMDVARDPAFARIARMNMYLHGDGGSRIYQADSLDKQQRDVPTDSAELKREREESRTYLVKGGFADVVLTNPPFAKEYERKSERETAILDDYELAFDTDGGGRKPLSSLKSSLMFLERYHDLLTCGGRMVTVIDDSILGGPKYARVRDYIREKYLIRAVVSLPGDAFQRSQARVKTSLLYLQKKHQEDEQQPAAYMTYCKYIGIDDPARQRVLPIDCENRKRALAEIVRVSGEIRSYLAGAEAPKKWIVSADRLKDRLDVKSVLLTPCRNIRKWHDGGYDVRNLADLVQCVFPPEAGTEELPETIVTADSSETVTHLRVRYDGFAEVGETIFAADSTYAKLFPVQAGDIAISNIGAVHGSVAVVPSALAGCVVTQEYTILRAKDGIDPRLIWLLIRAPESRADLLLLATGISRHRVRWDVASQLMMPIPGNVLSKQTVKLLTEADELEQRARCLRGVAQKSIEDNMHLQSPLSTDILEAFKPPD